jgi:antitoxin component HigA of HigAB toxin-antitoxin module
LGCWIQYDLRDDIRSIRTEADYDAALAEIEQYFDNEPERGTLEADRFDVVAALIGAYQREHWTIAQVAGMGSTATTVREPLRQCARQRMSRRDLRCDSVEAKHSSVGVVEVTPVSRKPYRSADPRGRLWTSHDHPEPA